MAGWNFFNIFRGNIVKWWRLVILPVFRLNNDEPKSSLSGESEKNREVQAGQDTQKEAEKKEQTASAKKEKVKKDNSDTWWGEAMNNQTEGNKDELFSTNKYKASADQGDAMDILKRMELEKQKELEELRRKAEEQERINAILNANRKNVDGFIEEGRAGRGNTETLSSDAEVEDKTDSGSADLTPETEAQKQEEMRRAQEILDRLNREAEEDEAKKAAEIEAAKAQIKS